MTSKSTSESVVVEVYRPGEVTPAAVYPFWTVARKRVQQDYTPSLWPDNFTILLLLRSRKVTMSHTLLHNLTPHYDRVAVLVMPTEESSGWNKIYPMAELIGQSLHEMLREEIPDIEHWGYRLNGGDFKFAPVVFPRPVVQGEDRGGTRGRGRSMSIQLAEEAPLPKKALADFGTGRSEKQYQSPVNVVVRDAPAEFLMSRSFSADVEEAGFLLGYVYADADSPGGFIVEITDAVMAQHTSSSSVHLTFTPDSFASIRQYLQQHGADARLVGWFHSHLPGYGGELSSIDYDLHCSTFHQPWQLAALVSLHRETPRKIEYFVLDEETMKRCTTWRTT